MGKLSRAIDDNPQTTRRIQIVDEFHMTIRYITQPTRERILRKCRERDNLGGQTVNLGKHAAAFTKEVVDGWDGLTVRIVIDGLGIPLKPDEIAGLQEVEKANGGTLPFDREDCAGLFRRSKLIDDKITDALDTWDHAELLAKVEATKND